MAQYRLALMYERGMGTSKDTSSAYKWYRQAAEQGYVLALGALKKISHQKSIYPELAQL